MFTYHMSNLKDTYIIEIMPTDITYRLTHGVLQTTAMPNVTFKKYLSVLYPL